MGDGKNCTQYKWVTIKSQIPDEFQLSHPDERPNPEKENKKIDPLRPDRSPEEKTVDIVEGQTGISYENLFLPYLQGADHIKICDPYIRLQYQIYNLMNFCEILEPLENKLTVIQVKHACRKLNYLNVVYRNQSFTHDPEKKSTYI